MKLLLFLPMIQANQSLSTSIAASEQVLYTT